RPNAGCPPPPRRRARPRAGAASWALPPCRSRQSQAADELAQAARPAAVAVLELHPRRAHRSVVAHLAADRERADRAGRDDLDDELGADRERTVRAQERAAHRDLRQPALDEVGRAEQAVAYRELDRQAGVAPPRGRLALAAHRVEDEVLLLHLV